MKDQRTSTLPAVPMEFRYWVQAWESAGKTALRSRKTHEKEGQVSFWNRRAKEFDSRVMPDTERVAEILQWLTLHGISFEGCTVLDVGSGPGAFALPLAEMGADVVALEPAESMVAALEKNLTGKKYKDRVRIVRKLWEDVDIGKWGWLGKFDLVFASMSPGINNWLTIEKALKSSRGHCYFSSFAGQRFNHHYSRLWELLYGQKMPPWPADILYINQLLLLRGYDVTLHVWNRRRPESLPPGDMADSFMKFFRMYGKEVPHMQDTIAQYVRRNLEDGVFSHEINTRLGKVLVKIRQ